MKGQYLAIEAVLTFGMGLIIALGTITVFNNYQQDIMSSTQDKQETVIVTELTDTLLHLRGADRAEKSLELPEDLGGSDYTVTFDEGVNILMEGQRREYKFNSLENFDFEGSVQGGEVKVYKRDNQFIIGAE